VLANAQGPALTEVKSLLDLYDAHNANSSGNTNNAELAGDLEASAMVGYPADARAFERDVQIDYGMCTDLPPEKRKNYEAILKELWTAFEAKPDEFRRGRFADEEQALHEKLAQELEDLKNDPKARLKAVFNLPFGDDLLDGVDKNQLAEVDENLQKLTNARAAFDKAKTPEERAQAVADASNAKQKLRGYIKDVASKSIEEQTRLWAEARADVLNALESASKLSGAGATAGGRLAYFGNRVFADARHARAFTDLCMQERHPFHQLVQWENELAEQNREAARTLPEVPLDKPRTFFDIPLRLPAPNNETQYETDLRALYVDALHSIVAADKRISIAAEPKSSPIRANYIKTHGSAN